MPTGAEVIVSELEAAGVGVCFGLPGVHNLALWEALRRSRIRLGVALTTTGPGAANTLAAVGEAWASRSPVLVIATDIASSLRRPGEYRGVLHETRDQGAMFEPVVKTVHRAHAAETVAPAAAAAIDE